MNPVFTKDDIDFKKFSKETAAATQVLEAKAYRKELSELIHGGLLTGDKLPWTKTHELIAFRPGETTIWAGANGAGKSLITDQVQMSFAQHGAKSAVGSFEMQPWQVLYRKLRMWCGHEKPTDAKMDQMLEWMMGRLFTYEKQGRVDRDELFGVINYSAQRLGVHHFWIDNLMMCVRGSDDYNSQKDFVERIVTTAKQLKIHIHIVAHTKKPGEKKSMPDRYDIRGASEISDLVEQVFIVHRNGTKELEVKRAAAEDRAVNSEIASQPDTFAVVDKQRNGTGWNGTFGLWFDKNSQQFLGKQGAPLINFEGKGNQ